jgi:hypothetical protein
MERMRAKMIPGLEVISQVFFFMATMYGGLGYLWHWMYRVGFCFSVNRTDIDERKKKQDFGESAVCEKILEAYSDQTSSCTPFRDLFNPVRGF